MTSPLYRYPLLYEMSLRILYRSHYRERIEAVADEIPDGSMVTDVCAGDCALHRYALRERDVAYLACDVNERFVTWTERKGIESRLLDVLEEEIPPADCVVMMGSLYQFIPHEKIILQKLIHAARRKAIITEPVRNLAQSRSFVLRGAARFLTGLGGHSFRERFTEDTLRTCLTREGFRSFQTIAGGREIIACLEKD